MHADIKNTYMEVYLLMYLFSCIFLIEDNCHVFFSGVYEGMVYLSIDRCVSDYCGE